MFYSQHCIMHHEMEKFLQYHFLSTYKDAFEFPSLENVLLVDYVYRMLIGIHTLVYFNYCTEMRIFSQSVAMKFS